MRAEAGVWFDDDHRTGLSARFYSLFSTSGQFAGQGNGFSVVNVPQFVPVGPVTIQIPAFVGFPGLTTGTVTASVRTSFTGGDLNLRRLLTQGDAYRLELLAGYRQLYLSDGLDSTFAVRPVGVGTLVTPSAAGSDSLHTRNNFYGPQLGLFASTDWNRVSLEAHAASALGVTASNLDFAHARTATTGPAALAALGLPSTLPAALAATNSFPITSTNISNTLSYFGVVAEGGLRLN